MEARARLLGHPTHEVLIVLPLGTLVVAVLFEILRLASGDERWAALTYWPILVGVLCGLATAVFCFADWTKIRGGTRAKRVGAMHGGRGACAGDRMARRRAGRPIVGGSR